MASATARISTCSSWYRKFGKRALDLALTLPVCMILLPVFVGLAVLVRVRLGSPVLFRQIRPGRDARPFTMIKFRTMTDARGPDGSLLPDEARLTQFGVWLRSTSLDELPELWNVLLGDLSLVGPRPLLMEYLSRYSTEQMRRHEVRPGITGWAQVNGRNALSWESKFAHDLDYVRDHGLLKDLAILWRTAWLVMSRSGITASGHVTAVPFQPDPPVVVIGAGGHGKVVVSALEAAGIAIEAVYDDDASRWGGHVLGVPITGPIGKLKEIGPRRGVVAIGDNEQRRSVVGSLPLTWMSVVHPAAVVHPSVSVGPGAVICAGTVLQPDCTVGRHVIVNTGARVDHDGILADFASVGPGASLAGGVRVGDAAMLGTGCVVLPGVEIGAGACVGAGATVTRHVTDGSTVVGCPARPVAKRVEWPATLPIHLHRPQPATWPVFDEAQIAAVERVLRSGKVNYWTGEECRQFEKEYAASLGTAHAIAVANGTVALELALVALGIGPDDEVIVPSRTFIATASAVVMRGGTPVIADIDPESQNLTAATIRQVLSPRTRAVIAVHLAGWPCDMDPIMELAADHNLFVIEDCAQAHGATYKGRPVGSIGHINAFSFCQDKIVSTGGEGGLVTTDDGYLWDRAWSYKDHGKSRSALAAPATPGSFRFLHESFGTNWRLTEMQAAIGRVQLTRLPAWVARRREIAGRIMAGLEDVAGLRFPRPMADIAHSYYRLYGLLDRSALQPGWTRDRIVVELLNRGVVSGCGSCGEIYREQAFAGCRPRHALPVARELHESSLVFLTHPTLTDSDVERTVATARDVLAEALVHPQAGVRRAA
jgi:sugar O-acyltransferase (sialic acid O-acetyltransferase NeuD family)